MLINVDIQVTVISTQVLLKVLITHFVEILKLAEVVSLFLYGIVGQVDELVTQVIMIELSGWRSDVSILVKIPLHIGIDAGDKSKNPEIKLSFIYEKRVVDIFLNDHSFVGATSHRPYQRLDLV